LSGVESPARSRASGQDTPFRPISNAVVELTAKYTGRGPTKSRTYVNVDAVTVFLQDNLTRGERTLVAAGQVEHVLRTRSLFQRAMRDDLVAAVERLTEREVVTFMSDNSVDPDYAVEAFALKSLPPD
jgi:uncharacterized protein YbcI